MKSNVYNNIIFIFSYLSSIIGILHYVLWSNLHNLWLELGLLSGDSQLKQKYIK